MTTGSAMSRGVPRDANSNPGRRISLGRRVPTGQHPGKSCNCHIGIVVLVGPVDQSSRWTTSSLSGSGVISPCANFAAAPQCIAEWRDLAVASSQTDLPPCAHSAATRQWIGDRKDPLAPSPQTDGETAGFQTLSDRRLLLPLKLPEGFHCVPSFGSLRVERPGVW
jgi:hypothetical protein